MTTPFDKAKSAILGVPVDPNKQPSRTGLVQAFAEMQLQLEGAQAGAIIKSTKSALDAMTSAPSVACMAWVTNDSTPAYNGIYENTGTAGAPAWIRRADIPQFFISATNVGAGTANAIQVTTDLPIPSIDGRCLIALPIVATNTNATVTVSINGGTPLTITRNYGTALAVGDLVNGVFYLGVIAGGQFRLINPARDVVETLPPDASVTAVKLALGAAIGNLGYTPENITNKNANNGYAGLKAPTVNVGVAGGRTMHGAVLGPSRIGSSQSLATDEFILLYADETYQNTGQEVRGITFTLRNKRTIADEASYGWDFIPASFGVVIDSANTQYIRGVQKPVVSECIFAAPATGTYAVRTAQNLGATIAIGANVDVERWVGLKIDTPLALESGFDAPSPAPEARIQTGYGIEISEQLGRVAKAAIKLGGNGAGARILWTNVAITEDNSGKLEINHNFLLPSLVNFSISTSATAGFSGGLPAQVAGYKREIINGTERRIPFYNA